MRISLAIVLFALMFSCTKLGIQPSDSTVTDLHIKMERHGCFGRCPVYRLEVSSNGTVTFDGKEFTKVVGQAQGQIPHEKIDEIIAAIKAADFFSLDDSYMGPENCPSLATDLPTVVLAITMGGRTKTVEHNHGCLQNDDDSSETSFDERIFPQELYRLQERIDVLADSGKWVYKDEIK